MQVEGRPSIECTATAEDGSRCARLTEVSMSRPTWPGSTPASASAFAPAMAALVGERHVRRATSDAR